MNELDKLEQKLEAALKGRTKGQVGSIDLFNTVRTIRLKICKLIEKDPRYKNKGEELVKRCDSLLVKIDEGKLD